ncbi:unnamed protein product, partial [Symbiodinium pilosum]
VQRELAFAAHLCEAAVLQIADTDLGLQHALTRMKKDADTWMKLSHHFVDCGRVFGSIFSVSGPLVAR